MAVSDRKSCTIPQLTEKITGKVLQGWLNPGAEYSKVKIGKFVFRSTSFSLRPFKEDQFLLPIFIKFGAANDNVGLRPGEKRVNPG